MGFKTYIRSIITKRRQKIYIRIFNERLKIEVIDIPQTIRRYLEAIRDFILRILEQDLNALQWMQTDPEAQQLFRLEIGPEETAEEIEDINITLIDVREFINAAIESENILNIIRLVSIVSRDVVDRYEEDESEDMRKGLINTIINVGEGYSPVIFAVIIEIDHDFPCPGNPFINFEYDYRQNIFDTWCDTCVHYEVCWFNKFIIEMAKRLHPPN